MATLKNRKGNIPIPMIVVFFIMIFIISFFVILTDKIQTEIETATVDTFNQTILNQTSSTLGVFDSGVPFLFFGFMLAVMLLAWSLRSTPALALILIMIVTIIAIIGASISNTFYDVARSDSLAASANDYTYLVYLNENLPLFLIILGFIVVIFIFAKPKAEMF